MNLNKTHAPFGTWPSSVTADMVGGKAPKLAEPLIHDGRIFWLQSVPDEQSRNSIMMYHDGQSHCILPRPLSAKSKVHEYGGGSYTIHGDSVFFVLADDQQVYRANFMLDTFEPMALTQSPSLRFADVQYHPSIDRIFAVCEDHSDKSQEPTTYLVSIPGNGNGEFTLLHVGEDFYSFPRISPDGKLLCWTTWNHPHMPWDNTSLWLADITTNGKLTNARKIAGNGNESLFQPQWSPNGELFCVSDRNNWWNIYRFDFKHNELSTITDIEGEFATPQWTFNMSTYGFLSEKNLLATYTQNGIWKLAEIDVETKELTTLACASSEIYGIFADQGKGAFLGASPTQATEVFQFNQGRISQAYGLPPLLNDSDVSIAQPVIFNTTYDQQAHAFFYPPRNAQYHSEGKPPLMVICHGGPTGATTSSLQLKIQYWTNRGFAVMDVNYRGSTGYGRVYRHLLHEQWGKYDVDDVCAAAEFAANKQWVDENQCIIKGGSAGGYTVLAALAFKDTFHCGVSLYGIGDLETLVADTHKFEARYLDSLIGPYPERKSEYEARSPIHSVDQIECPILVFQGLEDKVVPPNQAEDMVDAVKKKGLPVAYVAFPDEGHGFRQPHNVETMLNSEQEFYTRIFGLAKVAQPQLDIKNLNEEK